MEAALLFVCFSRLVLLCYEHTTYLIFSSPPAMIRGPFVLIPMTPTLPPVWTFIATRVIAK